MKRSPWTMAAAALAILGVGYLAGTNVSTRNAERASRSPLVLQKVQDLGDLHTARYTYQQVFDYETSRQPEEWTRYVPGMSSLVTASTRNRALLDANGRVEAGVDLSRAQVKEVNGVRVIVLPKPRVYPVRVDAKVHHANRGLLWRDDNIALKAIRSTEQQMESAAKQQGILVEAERNARRQIVQLIPEASTYQIDFEP